MLHFTRHHSIEGLSKRRLRPNLRIILPILVFALMAQWIRSYWRFDSVRRFQSTRTANQLRPFIENNFFVDSTDGELFFSHQRINSETGPVTPPIQIKFETSTDGMERAVKDELSSFAHFGFGWKVEHMVDCDGWYSTFAAPYYALVSLLAGPLVTVLITSRRGSKFRATGAVRTVRL